MSGPVRLTKANPDDIDRIMGSIGEVLGEEDPSNVFISLLAMSLIIQYPKMDIDQLQKGVLGASEWIQLYIAGLEAEIDGIVDPKKVN